ncbi:MAG: 5'/3'-nucleotidase SurE [Bacteroidia bacterium]|nr:5'/3'-nucleotidase SurE [Bacteroidia bacterium]
MIKDNKPLILVTNDDGINAKGIDQLIQIARRFGDVLVVAPDRGRSATSHTVTVNTPVYFSKIKEETGLIIYQCSGTSVDCVKFALNELNDQVPDFILAGINHGTNAAISIAYSGTMGAVMEGCIHGIPSAGFSLDDHHPDADFTMVSDFTKKIIDKLISNGLPHGVCLNVNFPLIQAHEVKGIKICRQASSKWVEKFDFSEDEHGIYFILAGDFYNFEPDAVDTDDWAMRHNYISIVPVEIDFTAHHAINSIKMFEYEVKV